MQHIDENESINIHQSFKMKNNVNDEEALLSLQIANISYKIQSMDAKAYYTLNPDNSSNKIDENYNNIDYSFSFEESYSVNQEINSGDINPVNHFSTTMDFYHRNKEFCLNLNNNELFM